MHKFMLNLLNLWVIHNLKFSCDSHEEIRHFNTDYCQFLSIATDEYSYRLLSTATVVTLVTKVVINVRTFSCKMPVTFCPTLNKLKFS
jgi:hypothetical protein